MVSRPPPRSAHPYHMHDCIFDQPDAISQILETQAKAIDELAAKISSAKRVYIAGIGTSWHAALVGAHLFRVVGGRTDTRAWHSFEFAAYPPPLSRDDLIIVLSHTGRKRYSREVLEHAGRAGAATALVTSLESEARLEQADVVVRTTHRDRSSAFTISHTGALTALAMTASRLRDGRTSDPDSDIHSVPGLVKQALTAEGQAKDLVGQFKDRSWYCFLGWGPNTATAYEAALKINEAAYDVTTAFQLEQFLHGPFVATGPGCLVTLIAPPGAGYRRAVEIAKAVKETGGGVAALVEEGDNEMSAVADAAIELPRAPEWLTPIVYLVPLQLFTYWLALNRGRNPDVFRLDDPRHLAARNHYQL
ncbi:MAG: SIS domain-containing protein [Chloroflexi bacterium]|nr:SIS domain-containing protein [Chloroflexota bacterium]